MMTIDQLQAWINKNFWNKEAVAGWVERYFIRRGTNAFLADLVTRHFRGKYSNSTDYGFYTGTSVELMANAYWDGSVYRRYATGKASKVTLDDDGTIYLANTNTSGAAASQITDFTVRATIAATGLLTVPNGIAIANETLDAYDEGTFTPVVADATAGGNTSAVATALGFYTKIGNEVHIDVTLLDISVATLTVGNVLYIRNLPFTSKSTANYVATGAVTVGLTAFTGYLTIGMGPSATWANINKITTGAGVDFVAPEDLTSGTADIIFSLDYLTD
jgi:hypothetical protein